MNILNRIRKWRCALFHEALKALREEYCLSQIDLCIKIGFNIHSYGYLESGERLPTLDQLKLLSDFYGVSFNR
ncbi:helix-turn-helix transcriptional regulator [Ammoniphilus sp. 3BR4]|uniref:helix-turn-helix transcriptional regulator n=1 Tax=Ammoniphilus sp. 3BR4 TaxID=3158265 RepID=UPI0034656395